MAPAKRSPLPPRKNPIKRTAIKRGRPKSKRAKQNATYETQIRRASWPNAPEHPDPSRWHLYHLDHVVPVSYGKRHRELCTVERMSGADNLQWLPVDENISKGIRLTADSRHLLAAWRDDPPESEP